MVIITGPIEDLSGVKLTMDDSHVEVRLAMNKAKRLRGKKMPVDWDMEAVAKSIKREPIDDQVEAMDQDEVVGKTVMNAALANSIVLNATAEFCRTLGDIPTYGMAGNRDEDEEELMDFERQLAEERRRNQEKEERKREAERLQERGGWNVLEGEEERGSDDSMDVDNKDEGKLKHSILNGDIK